MSVHTVLLLNRRKQKFIIPLSLHLLPHPQFEQLVVNRHQLSFEFIFLYITRNRTPTAPTEILDPMPSSFGDSY